jgi:hypothetical protein
MNRDDIIRVAKEAGFNQILATNAGADVWIDDGFYVENLERFAALVAAAEREACAKVCFDMAQRHDDIRSAALEMASEYIRARGET